MIAKRTQTMKDISTLKQLFSNSQLILATEFQRNSVWPQAAKAYLLDTILNDRPIPYLYFRRQVSAQSGQSLYEVIDGQQRIRAIFEFLDDSFRLSESKNPGFRGKFFSELNQDQRAQVLSYDLYVEELTGYTDAHITDMFIRMNRFVVKLAPQEVRNAKFSGKFKSFTERLASWPFWKTHKVFTALQQRRMRGIEFCAELTILLIEGPQDKKKAVDLYYKEYEKKVPFHNEVERKLKQYTTWIEKTLPDLRKYRFRKPTDLYALIGALDQLARKGLRIERIDRRAVAESLRRFEKAASQEEPAGRAARYVVAASRQTDNLAPRMTRIEVLTEVISEA